MAFNLGSLGNLFGGMFGGGGEQQSQQPMGFMGGQPQQSQGIMAILSQYIKFGGFGRDAGMSPHIMQFGQGSHEPSVTPGELPMNDPSSIAQAFLHYRANGGTQLGGVSVARSDTLLPTSLAQRPVSSHDTGHGL